MKKTFFWIILILGIFFTVGTAISILSYTVTILDKITFGNFPYLLLGILLDYWVNPAGMLGVILLIWAFIINRKMKKDSRK
ncbi:MAG: hypothetical protein ABIH85_00150 [Candidatus Omnitrophota bacterium]